VKTRRRENELISTPIPKSNRKTPDSIGFRANRYGPDVTSSGGGLNGTGVPRTLRKWKADQPASAAPAEISKTDRGNRNDPGTGAGSFSRVSTATEAPIKETVKRPNTIAPTGVSNVRVFFVPVATAWIRSIHRCVMVTLDHLFGNASWLSV